MYFQCAMMLPFPSGRSPMERWTDWQLSKAIIVILVVTWGIAMLVNGPLNRLLAFFGMQ